MIELRDKVSTLIAGNVVSGGVELEVDDSDAIAVNDAILALETLRLKIQATTKTISSCYADDAIYVVEGDEMTNKVIEILVDFGENATGNQIHLDKSWVINYDDNEKVTSQQTILKNMNIKNDTFKYLGIYMENTKAAQELNEEVLNTKLTKSLKRLQASKSLPHLELIEATTLTVDNIVNYYLTHTYISNEFLMHWQQQIDKVTTCTQTINAEYAKIPREQGGMNGIDLVWKK